MRLAEQAAWLLDHNEADGQPAAAVFAALSRTTTRLGPDAGYTGLTRGFTGRLARGIRNRLMEELNRNGTDFLPYPLQRGLVRNLSIAAEAAGRSDLLPLWAGQSARLAAGTDAAAFLNTLVEEVQRRIHGNDNNRSGNDEGGASPKTRGGFRSRRA